MPIHLPDSPGVLKPLVYGGTDWQDGTRKRLVSQAKRTLFWFLKPAETEIPDGVQAPLAGLEQIAIVAGAALEQVAPGAAVEHVLAGAALQVVVAGEAAQPVGPAGADQMIGAGATERLGSLR